MADFITMRKKYHLKYQLALTKKVLSLKVSSGVTKMANIQGALRGR